MLVKGFSRQYQVAQRTISWTLAAGLMTSALGWCPAWANSPQGQGSSNGLLPQWSGSKVPDAPNRAPNSPYHKILNVPNRDWNTQRDGQEALLRGRTQTTRFLPTDSTTTPAQTPNQVSPLPLPSVYSTRQAKRMTEQYKLDAAEAFYQKLLMKNPKSASAHLGLGKIAYYRTASSNQTYRDQRNDLLAKSLNHLQRAVLYAPNSLEARLMLGTLYMETGRLDEAAEQFLMANQKWPRQSEVLEKIGALALKQGNASGAASTLEEAIRRNPHNGSAYYHLGAAYTELGRLNEAHQVLQTALSHQRNNPAIYNQLGNVYALQGNGAAAVEAWQSAAHLKPEDQDSRLKLADHLEAAGDFSGALEQYNRLLESYPDSWDLYEEAATVALKNGLPLIASRYYATVLQSNPSDPRALQGLSVAKTETARMLLERDELVAQGKAYDLLQEAIEHHPDNWTARVKQYRMLGESPYAGAQGNVGAITAAVNTAPTKASDFLVKGELMMANTQLMDARQAFQSALFSVQKTDDVITLGELFLTMGQPDLAQQAFEKALKQAPNHTASYIGLKAVRTAKQNALDAVAEGELLMKKTNQRPSAVRMFQEALHHDAWNAMAHHHLAQIYERDHQYAQARQHYYAYLCINPMASNRDNISRKILRLSDKMATASGLPSTTLPQ